MPQLISSKPLPGGGTLVARAHTDGGTDGGDVILVELRYHRHHSEPPKTSAFHVNLGSLFNDEDYVDGVWDAVSECLEDLGVADNNPANHAAVSAVVEGLQHLLHRRSIKALLVASGALSLTRGRGCCAICLEDMSAGSRRRKSRDEGDVEETGRLPCSHEFHVECIVGWVIKGDDGRGSFPSCPLCRSTLRLTVA